MAVNKIIIGDNQLTFENDAITEIQEETAVSIDGDELFADQFVPICRYRVYLRYVFKPTNKDRFVTKDGLVLCGHYNYNLRLLPYGTKIKFYADGASVGVYYLENVERVGGELYQLNCVSDIGMMTNQAHKGGLYFGESFTSVVADILGTEYKYQIADDVAAVQVFGRLPYSTRRENLHQLVMAYGVSVNHTNDGDLLFTFLATSTPQTIPDNRVYANGSVNYSDVASRVEVVEHSYYYYSSVAEETLYDNTSSNAADNDIVIFKQPIKADTIRAASGNLTILEASANYAKVSGVGILVGKPYTHVTRIVAKDNPAATVENVISVDNATLVTLVNSENVCARLAQYYFNAITVSSAVINEGERCGKRYILHNAFGEYSTGFLAKMSSQVSGITKSSCEFIANYTPTGAGAAFSHVEIITSARGSWTIPAAVFEKETPNIRVICIGKGSKGADGASGKKGTDGTGTSAGAAGGVGGAGGEGGEGGKILSATLDCTGINSFAFMRSDTATKFVGGKYNLSSADGVSSPTGFVEMFTGVIYAVPGIAGQAGAAGGAGGYNQHAGTTTAAKAGGNVTYNGTTYKGGAAKSNVAVAGEDAEISENLTIYVGSGGGGGAAVGARGGSPKGSLTAEGAKGAKGADASPAFSLIGAGGNGGHGGGGGGGGGNQEYWNWLYSSVIAQIGIEGGAGGAGGEGSDGYQGGIIIYW